MIVLAQRLWRQCSGLFQVFPDAFHAPRGNLDSIASKRHNEYTVENTCVVASEQVGVKSLRNNSASASITQRITLHASSFLPAPALPRRNDQKLFLAEAPSERSATQMFNTGVHSLPLTNE